MQNGLLTIRAVAAVAASVLVFWTTPLGAAAPNAYVKHETWPATMLAGRAKVLELKPADRAGVFGRLWEQMEKDFPLEADWLRQDLGPRLADWFVSEGRIDPDRDPRSLEAYVLACRRRRAERLAALVRQSPRIVLLKHHNLAGSHYAYTEGQSDAQAERHFFPGAALCLLELDGSNARVRTLIEDPNGVIRDPDVSFDGRRILFSWKKSDREDDYHLYEYEVPSGRVRQLTFGLGLADYEGVYLPGGDILFNSTRCVQTVDCWWTEVSNLYRCDAGGHRLRRLSFDQVHTNYPQVLQDGRVVYTRWEYNDRGQIYPQPLFQMNADGTGQTEFYGNNSFFPTSILHARGIPGTQKLVAIASGHHSSQAGKLIVIDPARGRQENAGIQLIAPLRETPAEKIDAYGQEGDLWMYPWALSEREFLVTFLPGGRPNPRDRFGGRFGVFWMDIDGRRELLVRDPAISCCQALPLAPRPEPRRRPSLVDDRRRDGVFYLQDIYRGPGLAGVPRGRVKALRVVSLEYRAAGIGNNRNDHALISTPPAIGNGSWDVKTVLGTAPVYEDGSAMFRVPARTPVYFQALDAAGHAVQSMRSWSTLQPRETASCVGCHEGKSDSPGAYAGATAALRHGPVELRPFYGPPEGFSFARQIQPILDRHCTSCHHDRTRPTPSGFVPVEASAEKSAAPGTSNGRRCFSLLSQTVVDPMAKRAWSDAYLALTGATLCTYGRSQCFVARPDQPLVNWISAQSPPPMLPAYSAGAARSRLIELLEAGHEGVRLSQEELDKIACWIDLCVPFCGDYRESHAWSEAEVQKYETFLAKRRRMEAVEGGRAFPADARNATEGGPYRDRATRDDSSRPRCVGPPRTGRGHYGFCRLRISRNCWPLVSNWVGRRLPGVATHHLNTSGVTSQIPW